MNPVSRFFVALAVLATPTLAASLAEAVPPLPQTRIDAVHREAPKDIGILRVLPVEIVVGSLDEIAAPLSWDDYGVGYFARSMHEVTQTLPPGSWGRGRIGDDLSTFERRHDRPHVKKGKGRSRGHGRPDQPGRPEKPGRPDDPGLPGDPGDPGRPGDPGNYDAPTGNQDIADVREPSGAALLVIGMVGLFLAARLKTS